MNTVVSRISAVLLFVAVLFMVCGCQTFSFQPTEKILENRAAEMMAARVNQDWGRVYHYLNPEYKETVSKERFQSMARNISYRIFSVESVIIDPSGEKATVVVQYDMTMMGFEVPGHRETQEWIKKSEKWYFSIKIVSPMGNVQ